MKLDKSDALTIYSVLFHYLNTTTPNHVDGEHLADIYDRLHDFLSSEENTHCHEDTSQREDEEYEEDYEEEEDDELDEEDEEESSVEIFVTPAHVSDLAPIKVTSPDGSVLSFEFEDVDADDVVDVLIDDGSVIIEDVFKVIVEADVLRLHDGDQWHDFKLGKLPKAWKKTFPLNKVVGFHSGEDE